MKSLFVWMIALVSFAAVVRVAGLTDALWTQESMPRIVGTKVSFQPVVYLINIKAAQKLVCLDRFKVCNLSHEPMVAPAWVANLRRYTLNEVYP